ncbi:protein Skeletor, isoforms D/E-like [Zerene cesonia]|uniref:protein Skeletor, isoforms D/E-like n=1 Tax=Zerene cesonia TaxID=33412 RepID=UPI0018E4FE36|nr:protein Skeletor, isoforms D/E-like [Zerene cesonia]
MKDEIKRNSTKPQPQQYQVYEDVKESFVPEHPIRGDEYVIDSGKVPNSFMLPPSQKPQTLHAVMRPNSPNKPPGNLRPPFKRPTPPEIKLRRPYPAYQKSNTGYPLSMPHPHINHGMPKKQNKYSNNQYRPPMNGNRPAQLPPNIPPMKAMPPLHGPPKNIFHQLSKNVPKAANNVGQPIILGKPGPGVSFPTQSQTLSLGHTDLIANQVVKSQITLPGPNDAVAQQSAPQQYFSKPGQIILGKPMDNPLPLEQHIPQMKPHIVQASNDIPEYHSLPTTQVKIAEQPQAQNEIKSSDFIGQSADPSNFPPAVNTGFKPDSIVIESGFKPIIREPLMASEDKIAEYEGNTANRREDTDVEEDYEEAPQYINTNHAYPSDKITESFEPMFIPSPPDHLLSNKDKTKEVFPRNHAKEDRPHPVYVKTESELNALFSKKNMERDVPSDLEMESNRPRPSYLPPDPKLPKEHSQKLSFSDQTFTTYDGKTVSAATLTSVPEIAKMNTKLFSAKLPANSELILKTPQFGPFMGEIPPQVMEHLKKDNNGASPSFKESKTTHLKLVNPLNRYDELETDLKAEGSEMQETVDKNSNPAKNEDDDLEDYEDLDTAEHQHRRKRDTKAAQFERGEVEEQRPITEYGGDNNKIHQMDYDYQLVKASASKAIESWAVQIILLMLWYRIC